MRRPTMLGCVTGGGIRGRHQSGRTFVGTPASVALLPEQTVTNTVCARTGKYVCIRIRSDQ